MTGLLDRLGHWIARGALALDKALCFWPRWIASLPLYVILNRVGLPATDRSISGLIGKCAANQPWALIPQRIIDFIMRNPNHCQQAITDDGKD